MNESKADLELVNDLFKKIKECLDRAELRSSSKSARATISHAHIYVQTAKMRAIEAIEVSTFNMIINQKNETDQIRID